MRVLLIMILLSTVAACSTDFVDFNPKQGQVCDEVRIQREDGNNCGTHRVTFNGVPSANVRREGSASDADLIAEVPVGATTGPLFVEQNTGNCAFLGFFNARHTFDEPFTVLDSPDAPIIRSFTAQPDKLIPGEMSTLQWRIDGAVTRLTLRNLRTGSDVDVSGSTSRVETVPETTEFRLSAFNRCVSASRTLTVEVQERPVIRDVDSVFPGESSELSGTNFRWPGASSSVIFQQGARRSPAIEDPRPSDRRLDATVPGDFEPGEASAIVRVGSLESNPFTFDLKGRTDGPFVNVSAQLNTAEKTCDDLRLTFTPPFEGDRRTAVYSRGSRDLKTITINSLGGATFSPDCRYAVALSPPLSSSAPPGLTLFVEEIEGRTVRRENSSEFGFVMFSPGSTVLLTQFVDSFAGALRINLFDLSRNRFIAGTGAFTCGPCGSMNARVEPNYRDVRIDFGGNSFGPYRIE